jgi:hypothetical protein
MAGLRRMKTRFENSRCGLAGITTISVVCAVLTLAAVPAVHAACGDGIVTGGEECDPGGGLFIDGNPNNAACTTGGDCFYESSCCKFNCQFVGQGASCFDGNTCTVNDICDQVGACGGDLALQGTGCDDGLFCTITDSCDAFGVCSGTGDPCTGNAECLDVCDEAADACMSPAGTACGDPTDTECNAADTCDGAGTCQTNLATAGQAAPATCGDANDCTADVCDGAGGCSNPNLLVGTSCGDAADTECTDPDICDGAGSCVANDAAAGTTCGDALVTECTAADTCDGAGSCDANDVPAGSACGDAASTECTLPDTCDGAGTCLDNHSTLGAPAPTTCGDANECTADLCNGLGGCANPAETAGTPCGDPTDTQCDGADTCDGAGSCSANFVADATPCDDADECTLTDECIGGLCISSNNVDCDDGDLCTYDSCDSLTGDCSSVPAPAPICREAPLAQLKIFDKKNDAADKMKWKWVRGEDTLLSEFGSPQDQTTLELCIYDTTADESRLATRLIMPPGGAWIPKADKLYKYKDRSGSLDGVIKATLRALPRPSIGFKAKGLNFPIPPPFSAEKFFDQDTTVSAQLVNDEGQCWSTSFEDAKVNEAKRFVTIRKKLLIK